MSRDDKRRTWRHRFASGLGAAGEVILDVFAGLGEAIASSAECMADAAFNDSDCDAGDCGGDD